MTPQERVKLHDSLKEEGRRLGFSWPDFGALPAYPWALVHLEQHPTDLDGAVRSAFRSLAFLEEERGSELEDLLTGEPGLIRFGYDY